MEEGTRLRIFTINLISKNKYKTWNTESTSTHTSQKVATQGCQEKAAISPTLPVVILP